MVTCTFERPAQSAIGLKVLRPTQENRAFEILRPKLAQGGLKIFP